MKRLPVCIALVIVTLFAVAPSPARAQLFENKEEENLIYDQPARVENSSAMDFFIFPSNIHFDNVNVKWDLAKDGEASATIFVSPTISTQAFEKPYIQNLFADISVDDGKTWNYTKFTQDSKDGPWYVSINIPEWGNVEAAIAPQPPGAATGTAGMNSRKKQVKTIPIDAKPKNILLSFWAQDSLGNVTTEMAQQNNPTSEPEVRFQPLLIDPANQERKSGDQTEDNTSPKRDILDTAGAVVRNNAFFRMHVAGNPLEKTPNAPEYNYYIIRFIPLETTSFLAQLGRGIYQYYSILPPSNEFLSKNVSEGVPFAIDYDSRNIHQLAGVINSYKTGNKYDKVVQEYVNLLKKEGLENILKNKFSPPVRRSVADMGIVVRYAMNNIYWRVNMEGFMRGGKMPDGIMVRFYTAFLRDKDSTNPVLDDRTGYSTIYFQRHIVEEGASSANIQKYTAYVAPEIEPDEMDIIMREKLLKEGVK